MEPKRRAKICCTL